MHFEKEIIHYIITIREIHRKSLGFQLILASVVGVLVYNASVHAEDVQESQWMPDPHLRMAVRQELKIDTDTPLTQGDMHRLFVLASNRMEITEEISDLTGLEYAVRLHTLLLGKHRVQDLRPIANLTSLRFLGFNSGPISDLTQLSGLVNLETLTLWRNRIVDVSPLANLVNLRVLKLAFNQIEDFSPLSGLVNLEWLEIQRNRSSDISAIPTAKLTRFEYDETCAVPGLPFADRIEDREYPSVVLPSEI